MDVQIRKARVVIYAYLNPTKVINVNVEMDLFCSQTVFLVIKVRIYFQLTIFFIDGCCVL